MALKKRVEADPYKDVASNEEVKLDTSTTSKRASIVSALEVHALELQRSGQHAKHGAVSDVMVAAGTLKHKVGAIKGTLGGELGELIDRLHEIL